MSGKLRITQTGSGIACPPKQRVILRTLGLGKMHRTVELPDNPCVRGMVKKIIHLLKVEEVSA
ncbi:MAG: 50S ribosomal protein L30 [Myxococcales bacterium]|nr:50S ribosomal protein L30 [Myxococcales bacterium]